jgi:hypothetical protein
MTVSPLAGMGRLVQHDKRNLDYPLPLLTVPAGVRSRYWWVGKVLDQGDTPQCVGYAGWGWLFGGPVTNRPDFTPADLYHWAQENDEWPGQDYDGSSTIGLMKALKSKGYVSEYRWATNAETLIAWILAKGPVLVGTSWFKDMFTPDKEGFIHPQGENVGGHEWRIRGANRDRRCPDGTKGAVRMVNSWGVGWGDVGQAWLSFPDLDKLIKQDGEAVTVDEIKLAGIGWADFSTA